MQTPFTLLHRITRVCVFPFYCYTHIVRISFSSSSFERERERERETGRLSPQWGEDNSSRNNNISVFVVVCRDVNHSTNELRGEEGKADDDKQKGERERKTYPEIGKNKRKRLERVCTYMCREKDTRIGGKSHNKMYCTVQESKELRSFAVSFHFPFLAETIRLFGGRWDKFFKFPSSPPPPLYGPTDGTPPFPLPRFRWKHSKEEEEESPSKRGEADVSL